MLAIPPDFTFVIQIVSFFILWLGLKRLIWDPTIAILEQREARTKGARQEASALRASANDSAAEYDRKVQEAHAAAAGESQTARGLVEAEEAHILTEARNQAAKQLAQLRDNLARQADSARGSIAAEAQTLAGDMAARIVGRPLQ